jgi:phosphatidate cytidylyltransferase
VIAGWLTLVPAWLAVVTLIAVDTRAPWLLLSLLLVIWSADIGAYFCGRAWGRHRLAPLLSPGKTLEGVGGGLGAALLTAFLLGSLLWHFDRGALAFWLALCAVAALFSVAGDLHESLQKRRAGVKDSGHLLPGHGGVFDRIDSLTAAAPVFLAGWLLHFAR